MTRGGRWCENTERELSKLVIGTMHLGQPVYKTISSGEIDVHECIKQLLQAIYNIYTYNRALTQQILMSQIPVSMEALGMLALGAEIPRDCLRNTDLVILSLFRVFIL